MFPASARHETSNVGAQAHPDRVSCRHKSGTDRTSEGDSCRAAKSDGQRPYGFALSIALLAHLFLLGCGGGDPPPRVLSVEIRAHVAPTSGSELAADFSSDSCAGTSFRDNGHLVYVLAPQGCAPAVGSSVVLRWGTARSSKTVELPFTAFSDETAVDFEPGISRVVSSHRRGSWRSFPNTESWVWRDGAGLLAKDGGLYLLGGWNSDVGLMNDVWFTKDVRGWTQLMAHAPWPGRHGAGWVTHNDRLYVIGGDWNQDVWSSADGVGWTQHAQGVPFERYTPNVISTGRSLIYYAGQGGSEGLNNVWSSANGDTWSILQAQAPWTGRGLIHGGVRFGGRIYLIGGGVKAVPLGARYSETKEERSDIWSSSDGIEWRQEASTLGFPPRTHFAVLSTSDGCYVANGSVGTQANLTNEVFFAPDCVNFKPLTAPSPMGIAHATSMAEFNGSVVVLGGHSYFVGTTVWQYFPDAANE
jgi:hypothetical protein